DAQAIDVQLDLRYALSPLGELGKIRTHLQAAERIAARLNDEGRLALICSSLANYFQATGDLSVAVNYGHRAIELSGHSEGVAARVSATAYLSLTYQTLGDYPTGLRYARDNIEGLTGEILTERFGMSLLPAVYSRNSAARCCAEMGQFDA